MWANVCRLPVSTSDTKPELIPCFPHLINKLGFPSPWTTSYQLLFPQSLEQCAWHIVKV